MMVSPRESGQALLAWTAVLLFFVLVPLTALVGDSARLFFVRNRLQAALDAGCEDAAWSAADRRLFLETGQRTFRPQSEVVDIAHATFEQTLRAERGLLNYSATMTSVQVDYPNRIVRCEGVATVALLVSNRTVTIQAITASTMRFR